MKTVREKVKQKKGNPRRFIMLLCGLIFCFVIPRCASLYDSQEVTYSGDKIYVQNGTIVYKGNIYSDEAVVPAGSLVGIYKNGKAYLFHTDMAHATLDDNVSKSAIGYFIAKQSNTTSLSKALNKLNSSTSAATSIGTGITVSPAGVSSYTFSNLKKRWVAVKNRTQNSLPKFLWPRGDLIELNILKLLQLRLANVVEILQSDETTLTASQGDVIESYGSVIRLGLPLIFKLQSIKPTLYASIQNAKAHDSDLFWRINAVDYCVLLFDALEQISGLVVPEDCSGLIVQTVLDALKGCGIYLLTKGDEETRNKFAESFFNQVFTPSSSIPCAAEIFCAVGTDGTAAPLCVIGDAIKKKIFAIIGGLLWTFDNSIISDWDILNNDAYAEWQAPVLKELKIGASSSAGITMMNANMVCERIGARVTLLDNSPIKCNIIVKESGKNPCDLKELTFGELDKILYELFPDYPTDSLRAAYQVRGVFEEFFYSCIMPSCNFNNWPPDTATTITPRITQTGDIIIPNCTAQGWVCVQDFCQCWTQFNCNWNCQ
jgi:hypothetical protein